MLKNKDTEVKTFSNTNDSIDRKESYAKKLKVLNHYSDFEEVNRKHFIKDCNRFIKHYSKTHNNDDDIDIEKRKGLIEVYENSIKYLKNSEMSGIKNVTNLIRSLRFLKNIISENDIKKVEFRILNMINNEALRVYALSERVAGWQCNEAGIRMYEIVSNLRWMITKHEDQETSYHESFFYHLLRGVLEIEIEIDKAKEKYK